MEKESKNNSYYNNFQLKTSISIEINVLGAFLAFQLTSPKNLDITSNTKSTVKKQTSTNSTLNNEKIKIPIMLKLLQY